MRFYAKFWREVEPGEWLLIDENGIQTGRFAEKGKVSLCSFEFVYFARRIALFKEEVS